LSIITLLFIDWWRPIKAYAIGSTSWGDWDNTWLWIWLYRSY